MITRPTRSASTARLPSWMAVELPACKDAVRRRRPSRRARAGAATVCSTVPRTRAPAVAAPTTAAARAVAAAPAAALAPAAVPQGTELQPAPPAYPPAAARAAEREAALAVAPRAEQAAAPRAVPAVTAGTRLPAACTTSRWTSPHGLLPRPMPTAMRTWTCRHRSGTAATAAAVSKGALRGSLARGSASAAADGDPGGPVRADRAS